MGEGEGARRLLAGLEAAVGLRPVLVPIGRNRHLPVRGPRHEGPDAAGRQRCRDRDSPASIHPGAHVRGQPPSRCPPRAAGAAPSRDRPRAPRSRQRLPVDQLGRLLGIARLAVRANTEFGFTLAVARHRCYVRGCVHPAQMVPKTMQGYRPTSFALPSFFAGGS